MLADAVDALLPRRNDVVHAQWGKAPRGAQSLSGSLGTRNSTQCVLWPAELQQLALDLHQTAVTAMQLIAIEDTNPDETPAVPATLDPGRPE